MYGGCEMQSVQNSSLGSILFIQIDYFQDYKVHSTNTRTMILNSLTSHPSHCPQRVKKLSFSSAQWFTNCSTSDFPGVLLKQNVPGWNSVPASFKNQRRFQNIRMFQQVVEGFHVIMRWSSFLIKELVVEKRDWE